MRQLFLGVTMAAGLAASGAGAATLDFMGYANSGEIGVASPTSITSPYFDGETLTFTSNYNAYFDAGNAGLGVCKVLTVPGGQCNPAEDDNITAGEWVTVAFNGLRSLSDILLRAEGHVPLADSVVVTFGTDIDALQNYTYGVLKTMTFSGIQSMTFKYADDARGSDQFYVQSAVVSAVPLPAGAPLLLAALGVLGFGASRRRKARA